jgi:hypothetical protein
MTLETMVKPSTIFGAVAIAFCVAAPLTSAQKTTATKYAVRTLPLPDNGTGDVSMDYIAFDPATNSLWVPGGNTGAVDIVDVATDKVRQITDLPTAQVPARGGTRVLGPRASALARAWCTSAIAVVRRSARFTRAPSHVWRVNIWTPGPTVSPMSHPRRKSG